MNEADIPRINDEIACKFLKIEADLRIHRSARELLEGLITAIETEFAIPYVWLSILRVEEAAGLLKTLAASDFISDRLNIIEEEAFREVVPDSTTPLLACGDLRRLFRLLPPSKKYFIRSLAIAPLTFRGRLIGSLNHGDHSPGRYQPDMNTSLLQHLARTVSERLTLLLS